GSMIKIFVEHCPHSRGKVEAGEERLVEANASDDVDLLISCGNRTDGEQSERCPTRRFFLFEKRICRGIRACQRILITEFRRPLRRGDDRAAIVSELQEVEALGLSEHLGIIEKRAVVRCRTRCSHRHSTCLGCSSDGLYFADKVFTAAIEFAAELG